MLGEPYNHSIIRKTIIAFGELFSDTKVERYDDGAVTPSQVLVVPISYGPKEKWLRRLQENPTLQKTDRITVPRMSFEIKGYQYDPSRKLSNSSVKSVYNTRVHTPVPYNLTISLSILTRTQEDALNIMEQILPYFAPEMQVYIQEIDNPPVDTTFPLSIVGVQTDDNYDTDFSDQRIIVTTLMFEAKINLFGPILTGSVIKKSTVNVSSDPTLVVDLEQYTAEVDPPTANKIDTHTIIDNWVFKS